MEAHKLKDHKAKAVNHKGACHWEKHDNILCKIMKMWNILFKCHILIYKLKAFKYCVLVTLNI